MPDAASNHPLRIFLCHASKDKPTAHELYQRLRANGFEPWLDEKNLLPGQRWADEIPKAIRESDAVVVCLSQHAINKIGYVQQEIRFALDKADEQPEGAIFLIPLRLEECTVPDRLRAWQWVDYYQEGGYSRLMRALGERADDLGLIQPYDASTLRGVMWLDNANNRRVIGGLEFVRVPAGAFIMGNNHIDYEKPQHIVEIPYDYWIARYPVTNAQFAQFAASTNYAAHQDAWKEKEKENENKPLPVVDHHPANHPVTTVSWHDAMAYCKWLNDLARSDFPSPGLLLRLPTEAEWEKAARGGYSNDWPWGNEFSRNKCNSAEGRKGGTTPVGAYSPRGDSPYGAADMAGNVWEWCHSLSKPYPYQADDGREDEADSGARLLRGGAFYDLHYRARCACRIDSHPDVRVDYFGWRVVVSPGLG